MKCCHFRKRHCLQGKHWSSDFSQIGRNDEDRKGSIFAENACESEAHHFAWNGNSEDNLFSLWQKRSGGNFYFRNGDAIKSCRCRLRQVMFPPRRKPVGKGFLESPGKACRPKRKSLGIHSTKNSGKKVSIGNPFHIRKRKSFWFPLKKASNRIQNKRK